MVAFPSTLTQATLIRRYKRFLADVNLPSGEQITVHCPNTGAMTGCDTPHSVIYLSRSDNAKRKYPYTWEYAVDDAGQKICINTNNANRVIKSALLKHQIPALSAYSVIMPEQKVENARIDFLLQEDGMPDCYLEVKSATLAQGSIAMFPDTVTTRGQKHCYELAKLAKQGKRAILLFCVMREGINEFKIAENIDPDYARAVKHAIEAGVELLCYRCDLSLTHINVAEEIPILW